MKVEVVNDQNRVVTTDDQNVVVVQGGNSVTVADVGPQGPAGTGAEGYILQAYDTTDQTAASTTTAYPIKLNTVDISDGITVTNNGSGEPTRITFANDGDYNIQFSIQFQNSSASEAHVNVWFRQDGVDIPDSNSQATVPKKHGADDGSLILALNLIASVGSGQYVEIYWQTESSDVSIQALPAGTTPTTPATPSVIVTATVNRYLEVGPAGPGVATGGTTGQVLTKASATDYDTTWATPTTPGMALVKTVNIGSGVSTIVVSNAFSASHYNYKVIIDNPVGSITYQTQLNIQMGSASNNHYGGFLWTGYGAGSSTVYTSGNTSTCPLAQAFNGTGTTISFDITGPFASVGTAWSGTHSNGARFGFLGGQHLGTTSFTGFTLTTSSGTVTGGTVRVYGYNS